MRDLWRRGWRPRGAGSWLLPLCFALTAGSVGGAEAGEGAAGRDGRVLFERHCSACHGLDGSGRTPFSTLLRTPPADLRQLAARNGGEFPDVEVLAIVDGRLPAHGARDMPIWGRLLTDAELRAIVGHLHGLQDTAASARAPAPAGRRP